MKSDPKKIPGEELTPNPVRTMYGLFSANTIKDLTTGEIFPAITYKINWKLIQDKVGYYNLLWHDVIEAYVVIQYIVEEVS